MRILPLCILGVLLPLCGGVIGCHSQRGKITEAWETANTTFKVRVRRYEEQNGGFVGGGYYVFESAQLGSDNWGKIMTFRHDDPVPIPREQVRFVNDRIAYAFMGWMYAVTTDAGTGWSVWNAEADLPKWQCCNYALIQNVSVESDGTGLMTLNPIPQRPGEVPELLSTDYGKHWNVR